LVVGGDKVCWEAGAAYPRVVRSDLLQQSLTFLSKTDQNSPTTAQDPAKLNSANI
jgi:hypothetical protein